LLQGIRAVVFDAVGTLVHPSPSAPEVYGTFGRQFGSQQDISTIHERFHEAFRIEEKADQVSGWRTDPAREEQRWRAIVARTLPDVRDCEACFQTLWHYFAQPASWRATNGAGQVLTQLKERGLSVGVASNFDSRLRTVLAGISEFPRDLSIVVSAEVGWRKPAPEFFAAVVDAIGVSPNEILMVGDDEENDVAAARAAGLRAVLFEPTRTLREQIKLD
jgi:putative hydrolase of the HAD superfamily